MCKPKPVRRKSQFTQSRWSMRDFTAASTLFIASTAVVLWQNAHLDVLWDTSYILDTAFRISLGQAPYRDFPLAQAPQASLDDAAEWRGCKLQL
jgi:hypothetical protein